MGAANGSGTLLVHIETHANCRMVDSSDPSPRPSPGGRGRSSGVCIFYAEWTAHWLRLGLLGCLSVLRRSPLGEGTPGEGSRRERVGSDGADAWKSEGCKRLKANSLFPLHYTLPPAQIRTDVVLLPRGRVGDGGRERCIR